MDGEVSGSRGGGADSGFGENVRGGDWKTKKRLLVKVGLSVVSYWLDPGGGAGGGGS